MSHSDEAIRVSLDDRATLDAAHAFVDEYDLADFETGDNHTLVGLTLMNSTPALLPIGHETVADLLELPTIPAETKASIAPAPVKRPLTNRSRTRQKDELVYLRSVVEDLEQELSALKKRSDDPDGTNTVAPEPLAFVWEELAARQYAQRQRAEVENVKLRTMLEEQIRVAKNLERLLKKRTMAEFLVPASAKRVRKTKDTSAIDDPFVFDELLATIDEMLTKVDDVFADEHFAC